MALKLESAEQEFGVTIVRRVLEEPMRQIVANAGGEASVVVNEIRGMEGVGM